MPSLFETAHSFQLKVQPKSNLPLLSFATLPCTPKFSFSSLPTGHRQPESKVSPATLYFIQHFTEEIQAQFQTQKRKHSVGQYL